MLDETGVRHTVIGVSIVRPISVKAYPQGYILGPARPAQAEDQELLQQQFWSSSQPGQRVALLQGDGNSLIAFDSVQTQNRQVVFSGELRYDTPPRFSGQDVVRLNKAATVVDSSGVTTRHYSSNVDLVAVGRVSQNARSEWGPDESVSVP
jgi:hypothetical protein